MSGYRVTIESYGPSDDPMHEVVLTNPHSALRRFGPMVYTEAEVVADNWKAFLEVDNVLRIIHIPSLPPTR